MTDLVNMVCYNPALMLQHKGSRHESFLNRIQFIYKKIQAWIQRWMHVCGWVNGWRETEQHLSATRESNSGEGTLGPGVSTNCDPASTGNEEQRTGAPWGGFIAGSRCFWTLQVTVQYLQTPLTAWQGINCWGWKNILTWSLSQNTCELLSKSCRMWARIYVSEAEKKTSDFQTHAHI